MTGKTSRGGFPVEKSLGPSGSGGFSLSRVASASVACPTTPGQPKASIVAGHRLGFETWERICEGHAGTRVNHR